jgi:hypothetical protein
LDPISLLVEFAVPKPARFGPENFAGDPLVKEFCSLLLEQSGVSVAFFVAWACPPRVRIIRSSSGNAVIRSERLDTLLVEYFHLADVRQRLSYDPAFNHLVDSTILRWLTELFIGYRQAAIALAAFDRRTTFHEQLPMIPFRDESLASIPPLLRTALQCFPLAHEVGHILYDPLMHADLSLETSIDGMSLGKHVEYEVAVSGVGESVREQLGQILLSAIDPPALVEEIEADLFAFGCVVQYLVATFDCEVDEAIKAALLAYEAEAFITSCMETSRVVVDAQRSGSSMAEFLQDDYVVGANFSIRARAVLRRAGILWAKLANPEGAVTAKVVNQYVPLVDAMFEHRQTERQLLAEKLCLHSHWLVETFRGMNTAELTSEFERSISRVQQDADLKLELWQVLIAFGCPGGTDVAEYLRMIQSPTQ